MESNPICIKKISKFAYKLVLTRFWCESNNEKIPLFEFIISCYDPCVKKTINQKTLDKPNKYGGQKDSATWAQHISFYEGQLSNPTLYLHIFVHKNCD